MKFALNIGSFFCKVIGFKNENKRNNKELKTKKISKIKNDNSKIYLRISLELLRTLWGQFSFRSFLVPLFEVCRPLLM